MTPNPEDPSAPQQPGFHRPPEAPAPAAEAAAPGHPAGDHMPPVPGYLPREQMPPMPGHPPGGHVPAVPTTGDPDVFAAFARAAGVTLGSPPHSAQETDGACVDPLAAAGTEDTPGSAVGSSLPAAGLSKRQHDAVPAAPGEAAEPAGAAGSAAVDTLPPHDTASRYGEGLGAAGALGHSEGALPAHAAAAGPHDDATGGSGSVGLLPPAALHAPGTPEDEAESAAGGASGSEEAGAQGLVAAGVGAGARRGGRIGTETTGPIPVHLLFRDDSDGGTGDAHGGTGAGADGGDDDGGPDTVAMAPVVVPPGRKPLPQPPVLALSKRPVPPVDPRLHERPGPVLPGWTGLLIGAAMLTGCAGVLYRTGAYPARVTDLLGLGARPYVGIGFGQWVMLALGMSVALFALAGLGRGRAGHGWVLTLFGEYRGSVRRCGLMWVSPLLLRRRVDVRLRHWRSEPMPAVDANGTALQAIVLVVWRVQDTARAVLAVADHEAYLREQVEAAMARVFSQLPADALPDFGKGAPGREDVPTLRNVEAVGDVLTKTLSAECAPVGIEIFSAQPTRVEYAPEVAAAMRRRRISAIDAEHRDAVLTSVVDAVDDTVQRLTVRGLVELDDYERKALVRDLTVAFCTGRPGGTEGP
ncbi:SPFH domain-containing protein [Streptomyces sp. NPDC057445]|uniref:SPFH domain-containing protein n=1 Tax=Streptomyces sp. NPDC057445 TaxID=3346136 RepID=UPI00369AC654